MPFPAKGSAVSFEPAFPKPLRALLPLGRVIWGRIPHLDFY
jgi:hypothetical protein